MSSMKTFVLTGCASGIGRHLTEALIRDGHRVVATDINVSALGARAREQKWEAERVLIRELDVRDAARWGEVIAEAAARFGGVDVVINMAGYLRPGWLHEMPAEEVDRHIDINSKGVILGTQVAARHMIARRQGHIINIASMAALVPVPGLGLYSASKYAVRAVSIAAAQELRPYGVYVTVICPDAVQTPMLDLQKSRPEAALTFSAPRLLSVEDIARVILKQVLRRKPIQVIIPAHRGWLARLADLFPTIALRLDPILRRIGRVRQARLSKK